AASSTISSAAAALVGAGVALGEQRLVLVPARGDLSVRDDDPGRRGLELRGGVGGLGLQRRRVDERARAADAQQLGELVGAVAEVHVDRDGAELEGGVDGFEELGPVVQVDADAVAVPDAESVERAGESGSAVLELAEAQR